jgi:hypothetical protein
MTVGSPDNLIAGMSIPPEAAGSAAKLRQLAAGSATIEPPISVALQKSRRFVSMPCPPQLEPVNAADSIRSVTGVPKNPVARSRHY